MHGMDRPEDQNQGISIKIECQKKKPKYFLTQNICGTWSNMSGSHHKGGVVENVGGNTHHREDAGGMAIYA